MVQIDLKLDDNGQGAFYAIEEGEQLGEMVMSIEEQVLTVYHTEVAAKAEGKGLAKQLLISMVDYARLKELKVLPLCPYVHAQFKRHPELYNDIWLKEAEENEA